MKIQGIVEFLVEPRRFTNRDGMQVEWPQFIINSSNERMHFSCNPERFAELQRQGFANGARGELRYWQNAQQGRTGWYNSANPMSWVPEAVAQQPVRGQEAEQQRYSQQQYNPNQQVYQQQPPQHMQQPAGDPFAQPFGAPPAKF